jgi:hypothetical protein
MKRVVLRFPDTASLTEFLLFYKIPGAEIDAIEHTLTAILTEEQLEIACKRYKAIIKLSYSVSR